MPKSDPEKISQVENSLMRPMHLVGESGENIFSRMEALQVPSVSITVSEDSKIAWTKGYTQHSDHSPTTDAMPSLFQAASISKTVNAVLALKLLVETGKIGLDDDVRSHLID